jgi:hypothetical protein
MRLFAIGIDANELYTLFQVLFRSLAGNFIRTFDKRAVIAGKKDDECLGILKIQKFVGVGIKSPDQIELVCGDRESEEFANKITDVMLKV